MALPARQSGAVAKYFTVARKKTPEEIALVHRVETRVTSAKFEELQLLLCRSEHNEMAGLIRDILHNRVIRTITYDRSLDTVMEELAALRGEIRAIGVNINQITKHFNTYPEPQRKAFYARTALDRYEKIEPKIDRLLELVTHIAKVWLPKYPAAGR